MTDSGYTTATIGSINGDMMSNFDTIQNYIYRKRNGGLRVSLGGLNPTGASCEITNEQGNPKLIG